MLITKSILYEGYTSTELVNKLREIKLAIFPIGSIEYHGEHLPLDTDTFIAKNLALKLSEYLINNGIQVLVLPSIPYGASIEWQQYPGTITLRPMTIIMLIEDIILSLVNNRIKRILILNAHGGNSESIRVGIKNAIIKLINEGKEVKIMEIEWWKVVEDEIGKLFPRTPVFTHADEIETSIYLALGGELRKTVTAVKEPSWLKFIGISRSKVAYYDTISSEVYERNLNINVDDLKAKGLKLVEAFCKKTAEMMIRFLIGT